MKLAKEMLRFLKEEDNPLGFSVGLDGHFRGGASAFPELRNLGFVAWSGFDPGGGGETGFYWPLGFESEQPIVCSVDEGGLCLTPLASNFEAFLNLVVAQDPAAGEEGLVFHHFDQEEAREAADFFHLEIDPEIEGTCGDARAFLEIDPDSPFFLSKAGTEFLHRGDKVNALNCYQKALDTLPEFGDVAFKLGQLLKSSEPGEDLAYLLIDILTSPLCLGGDRPSALRWLQSCPKGILEDSDEPIWKCREDLTFDLERDASRGLKLYRDVLKGYCDRDEGNQAIGWWIHVGGILRGLSKDQRAKLGFSEEGFSEELKGVAEKVGFGDRLVF